MLRWISNPKEWPFGATPEPGRLYFACQVWCEECEENGGIIPGHAGCGGFPLHRLEKALGPIGGRVELDPLLFEYRWEVLISLPEAWVGREVYFLLEERVWEAR